MVPLFRHKWPSGNSYLFKFCVLVLQFFFAWAILAQDPEEPEFEFEEEKIEVFSQPERVSDSSNFWTSWIEYRYGRRDDDPESQQRTETLDEVRFQFEMVRGIGGLETHFRTDILQDFVLDDTRLDLREFYIKPPMPHWASLSLGRQIIMVGLGDVIFINDLLPKDFTSFFIGRDAENEYMKLPSDSVKFDIFTKAGVFNLIYGARFRQYDSPEGPRLGYFNPMAGRIVGYDMPLDVERRDRWFKDDFWQARYTKTFAGHEFYLYLSDTYYSYPLGMRATGQAYFPRLKDYGLAFQGNLFSGIYATEMGYYDSGEDPDGDDPFIPNSDLRWFFRYDKEVFKDFHVGSQYQVFHRLDHDAYVASLPAGWHRKKRQYQLLTLRLTRYLLQQNLMLSFFTYYSPTEEDYYMRTNMIYKYSDKWHFHVGTNHFGGKEPFTVYGQNRDNNNIFLSARYMIH